MFFSTLNCPMQDLHEGIEDHAIGHHSIADLFKSIHLDSIKPARQTLTMHSKQTEL